MTASHGFRMIYREAGRRGDFLVSNDGQRF
jgi:hypothetical protein